MEHKEKKTLPSYNNKIPKAFTRKTEKHEPTPYRTLAYEHTLLTAVNSGQAYTTNQLCTQRSSQQKDIPNHRKHKLKTPEKPWLTNSLRTKLATTQKLNATCDTPQNKKAMWTKAQPQILRIEGVNFRTTNSCKNINKNITWKHIHIINRCRYIRMGVGEGPRHRSRNP